MARKEKKDLLFITDEDLYLKNRHYSFGEFRKDDVVDGLNVFRARLKFYINKHHDEHTDDYQYGLSLKRFGELSGFNDSYLNKLLEPNKDKPIPSMNMIFRFSYFFNVLPKEFIEGLEQIIKLPGYKIYENSIDFANSELDYLLKLTDAYSRFCKDPKNKVENEKEHKNKVKLIPVDFLLEIEDSSMDAYGIKKGSSLLYKSKYNEVKLADNPGFINSEYFINGNVYVVELGKTKLIRRLWKVSKQDTCVLIPCSTSPDEHEIMEAKCDNIKIIGIPINATISLNEV